MALTHVSVHRNVHRSGDPPYNLLENVSVMKAIVFHGNLDVKPIHGVDDQHVYASVFATSDGF